MRKKFIFASLFVLLLLALLLWIIWENTALELNSYTIKSKEIPDSFNGYRIAHISDLHNVRIGEENEKLLKMIEAVKPNLIAITGDLIDSRKTKIDVALKFMEKAVQIAPCYYVTGNHEARVAEYQSMKEALLELGVVVLENKSIALEKNNETIFLIGVDDPSFKTDYLFGDAESVMQERLGKLASEKNTFTVLLSHRPELFSCYAEHQIDLVLAGHAHGGQFRLPFVGGVVAPNQGVFPQYDAGRYEQNGTNMIVSRGIGNSIIPLRINNRPEVILIELLREE